MKKKFNNNLISIIMPAYNSEKYIEESIKSVIRQSYLEWELLVIDDCSKDDTRKIIESYSEKDYRIRLFSMEKNSGVAFARNEGIKYARGRYIAFLDSDDLWLPQKLKHQLIFMKKNKAEMSCTQYRQFGESKINSNLIDVENKINYKELLKGNSIGCLTVIIDRKYINYIAMPAEHHEDYVTWLNIMKQGFHTYGLKEDLARYRKNANSLSGNKFRSLVWTWNVYYRSQRLSLLKSFYYFCHYLIKGLKKHI